MTQVQRFKAELAQLTSRLPTPNQCVSGSLARYDWRVIVSTTALGVVCTANWLVYAIRCAAAGSKTRTQKMFTQHMTLFLQITFLFYPTLSLMQVGGSGVGVRHPPLTPCPVRGLRLRGI